MAAVGVKSGSKAGSAQTEEEARLEEGAAKKQASLLNKIFFCLLMFFSIGIIKFIRLVSNFFFGYTSKVIGSILLSSFKKELRNFLKIQYILKKLQIYNENDKYEKDAKDVVKEFIEENGRVLFLPNVECKKKGLRHLIEIVKEHYSTEIEDRAQYLDDSGSILKKGLMPIAITLAFACCLPFLAIGFIAIGFAKALMYFPYKLARNSSIFKDIRDEEVQDAWTNHKHIGISICHTSLVSELLVNVGLIDKLAEIRHKAYKNCTMLEDASSKEAAVEMQIRQHESDFVDEFLVQKVTPLEKGSEAMKKLMNIIITTDGSAPCKLACCTGRNGI